MTSVAAVAARLGQSLTEMEQPLHILPASCDLDAALALPGTKVLMKSGSAIHETVAALGRAGLLKRASMVADCGLPSERVFRDLREIPENVSYFATILVRSGEPMQQNLPRLILAGTNSGCGKTTVACAVCRRS